MFWAPSPSSPTSLFQTVQDLINILDGLQQWNEDVLQANASKWVWTHIAKFVSISPIPMAKSEDDPPSSLVLAVLCAPLRQLSVCLPSRRKMGAIFLWWQTTFSLLLSLWVGSYLHILSWFAHCVTYIEKLYREKGSLCTCKKKLWSPFFFQPGLSAGDLVATHSVET